MTSIELEKLKNDPDFLKVVATQAKIEAQKEIEANRNMQRLNNGELYVVLKEVYLSEGKDKTKKEIDEKGVERLVPQIDSSTGEVAKWDDRYLLTFSNIDLGSKQFEVTKDMYELYKNKLNQDFIISYELDSDRYDSRRVIVKIKTIKTVEQYRNTKESENE